MKRIIFAIMTLPVLCGCFVACTPGEALPDDKTVISPDGEEPESPEISGDQTKEAIRMTITDVWTED